MVNITAHNYPARYANIVGEHRLVGWGRWDTLSEQVMARTFGFMVRATEGTVKEYHGDLFHDAAWLRREFEHAFGERGQTNHAFMVCVRYHGTNVGDAARLMFESWNYDAALYMFEVYVDDKGEWHLTIDLLDARPDRPADKDKHSPEVLGLRPVDDYPVDAVTSRPIEYPDPSGASPSTECTCKAREGGYSTHLTICPAYPSWV